MPDGSSFSRTSSLPRARFNHDVPLVCWPSCCQLILSRSQTLDVEHALCPPQLVTTPFETYISLVARPEGSTTGGGFNFAQEIHLRVFPEDEHLGVSIEQWHRDLSDSIAPMRPRLGTFVQEETIPEATVHSSLDGIDDPKAELRRVQTRLQQALQREEILQQKLIDARIAGSVEESVEANVTSPTSPISSSPSRASFSFSALRGALSFG